MAVVPKQTSALWALAAAGGLWAWQNRDKISGYIKQSGLLGEETSHRRPAIATQGATPEPATGVTKRIGGDDVQKAIHESHTGYDDAI
ncbi:hypothetical protein F8S13_06190 [Chloroflexia bacterium SDU3-3]|nr:hypothetical protein F8S13_06190 [Chloroflexia bacterium SDU3-3]